MYLSTFTVCKCQWCRSAYQDGTYFVSTKKSGWSMIKAIEMWMTTGAMNACPGIPEGFTLVEWIGSIHEQGGHISLISGGWIKQHIRPNIHPVFIHPVRCQRPSVSWSPRKTNDFHRKPLVSWNLVGFSPVLSNKNNNEV